MRNEGLITNHLADAAIGAFRICKHGSADGYVAHATASTEKLIGIANHLGAAAAASRVDVVRSGIAEVEYGGSVTRGDPLTSDADGKAVAAAPGSGTNAYIIGLAEVSGSSGDTGSCLLAPGRIQG
jgi:hypothetical protein